MSNNLNPPGQESFNELLIKTVRLFPPLYINNRRAFESVDRNVLWEEVAKKIGRQVTPEFAKKRWLQLRDRYRKELKIAIAQGFTQPHRWSHFHLLKWLDPYLQGSLSTTAREYQENVCSDGAYSVADAYSISNSTLLDLAKNLFTKLESCDSELLDDVKPSMSTMQSVLAAAEASAKAAVAAGDNPKIDDLSTCTNVVEILEQMKKNALAVLNPDYSRVEASENPFAVGLASSGNSTVSSTTKACLGNEMEELPGKVRRKRHRFRPPTFKTLRTYYRLRARSNTFRLKCTKRIRRLKSFKTGQIDAETSITPSCLGCSSSLVSSWFDDEEMLFARIIALRLKKMSNARRNAARLRISQVLDDEESLSNGCNETGTSVAE
ncbi:unnamed protein product [Enterobius vermicularis]|uniref:MADF domain-containing protein n=1 Tax=Enterobius vermicularis TaxID=51028 RepID=A0A0N4VH91_ENTVE|nr:unnamed protein product [Enterobius vermicularis]